VARAMYQASACGDTPPLSQGGPKVGNSHQLPWQICEFNRKWVGIPCNRQAKGGRATPLAPLS
jgi:hypothetical protein